MNYNNNGLSSLLWGVKGLYNSAYIFDYWCNDFIFITKDSSSSLFIVVTIIVLVMLLQRAMVVMIIVVVFVIITEIVHVVIVFLSLHLKANLYGGSKF
jgi:hypothetical protein